MTDSCLRWPVDSAGAHRAVGISIWHGTNTIEARPDFGRYAHDCDEQQRDTRLSPASQSRLERRAEFTDARRDSPTVNVRRAQSCTNPYESKRTMSTRNTSNMRSSLAPSQHKSRQLAHLHSQLAQLQAHLSDLDNHLRVTSIQAEAIRRLGGLQAGLL